MYSRVSLRKIVLACAKFRDGVDSRSYPIILSLRDGSLLLTPFLALRARLLSCVPPGQYVRPSGTIRASLRDNKSPGDDN